MAKRPSAAVQARSVIDEVLRIAHAQHASATRTSGSKAHITITKQVIDGSDPSFRFLLSGIEIATRQHFAQVFDTGTLSEWVLKSPYVDVTARCSKGGG